MKTRMVITGARKLWMAFCVVMLLLLGTSTAMAQEMPLFDSGTSNASLEQTEFESTAPFSFSDQKGEASQEEPADDKEEPQPAEIGETSNTIAPGNDNMADAYVIASLPYTHTVDTTDATTEASEPAFSCGYAVGATVWYRYTPASTENVYINTIGSGFDTVLHVVETNTMTEVGCNDDINEVHESGLTLELAEGTEYLIGVGGFYGDTGSITLNIIFPAYNDNMADAYVADSLPYTNIVDTTDATTEASEPGYSCGFEVGNTVWYSYTPASTETVDIDITESSFDTVLHVFEASTMTVVGCNDNFNIFSIQSRLSLELTGGTEYLIGVGGNLGDSGTMAIHMKRIAAFTSCADVDIPQAECEALVELYNTTNGDSWNTNTNWLETNSVCDWDRVSCSGSSVDIINFNDNNLSGTLDVDLSALTNLVELKLEYNSLDGDLTTIINNLPTSLERLNLTSNNFTGTVPASLRNFTDLESLYLNNNSLDGDLSTFFNNIPLGIIYLSINENNFSGSIPASISNLTSLSALFLSDNTNAYGTIPMSITTLTNLIYAFFDGTHLCEPTDPAYDTWKASLTFYFTGTCGYSLTTSVSPAGAGITTPSEGLHAYDPGTVVEVTAAENGGYSFDHWEGDCTSSGTCEVTLDAEKSVTAVFVTAQYNVTVSTSGSGTVNHTPGNPYNYEDTATLEPVADSGWEFTGWTGTDAGDLVDNGDGTWSLTMDGDKAVTANFEEIPTFIFEDDFETGDLSAWSSYNDGGGFLYACNDAAINGSWGACVERGTNDKRKQLIDETPVYQTSFTAQINFDINSLSMAQGERFRFLQVKMDQERPFLIVLKYDAGQYWIQLNAKQDDLLKLKTDWYLLTDEPHIIEVNWQAATSDGANDGFAEMYIDGVLQGALTGMDNDTLYVDSFKVGFTSRLDGRAISGIFYVDDVFTSNTGYIGLP